MATCKPHVVALICISLWSVYMLGYNVSFTNFNERLGDRTISVHQKEAVQRRFIPPKSETEPSYLSTGLKYEKDKGNNSFHSSSFTSEATKTATLTKLLRLMQEEYQPPSNISFGFNVSQFDRNPIDENIPDARTSWCKQVHYRMTGMPDVSVVIVFHNEALTMLLRHIHLMIKNSPSELLTEIILVDDFSFLTYPHLNKYLRILDSRITVLKNSRREGVVRSRLAGAKLAKGEIIVFLDAHMRCSPGWLEPLVDRLRSFPNKVLQPLVPTLERVEAGISQRQMRAGFGWDLRFAWYSPPRYLSQIRSTDSEPYPSPSLVGCAIAVNRDHFFAMGGFDPNLEIWGGEHFELAFRTWMCGGLVETIPCSVVGHLYRPLPYSFGGPALVILAKNLLRVANVWMDEYKHIVERSIRGLLGFLPVFSQQEMVTIDERRSLRRQLNCKDFTWYLEHIFPEAEVPANNSVYFGEFLNVNTSHCLTVENNTLVPTKRKCGSFVIVPENHFTVDSHGRFRHKGRCIVPNKRTMNLIMKEEHCFNTEHFWYGVNTTGPIVYSDAEGKLCLTHDLDLEQIRLNVCDVNDQEQMWASLYYLKDDS